MDLTGNFSKNLPIISVRGTEGTFLLSPNENDYSKLAKFNNFGDTQNNCRISTFDPTGKYFAYCNGLQINAIDLNNDCKQLTSINKGRTSYLKFSPLGSYLVTWETFYVTKDDHKDVENLSIYEVSTGKLLKSFVQKKYAEKFVEWADDESFYAILNFGEVHFYEKSNQDEPAKRIRLENLSDFTMHGKSKHIAALLSGKKSEPSSIRLFKYPNVMAPIATKSFFNADKVEFKWNKAGTNLLLHCSTETSQNSYYGDSTLHQVTSNGESQIIQLSKKGPIYSLDWNPVRDEFIVVYGTMPAKATLFNAKGEVVFDFGTGSRNECFFNRQGTIVCLAGFGNLRGRLEMWSLSASNKVPQELCVFTADDTTYFEWSPDGEHILTATTAPRLRVSNGFKIWDYYGNMKHSFKVENKNELWQVQWQPGLYPTKPVFKKKDVPVAKEETKAYVPPHLRGANSTKIVAAGFNTKLHNDDEAPDKALRIKSPDDDIEKKIKSLRKKLIQIQELKKKQASGQKLEMNQLEKIKSENELVEELKALEIKN